MEIERGNENREVILLTKLLICQDELLESQSVVSISSRASGKTLPPTPKSLTELASYGKSSLRNQSNIYLNMQKVERTCHQQSLYQQSRIVSCEMNSRLVDVITQLPPHVQQNLLGLLSVMVNELNSSKEDTKPSEQTNQK